MVHPFDSITEYELKRAVKIIQDYNPTPINFTQLDRIDPPKSEMLEYLKAERAGLRPPEIARRAYAYYYKDYKMPLYKALINITYGHVIVDQAIGDGLVGPMIPEEVRIYEKIVNEHPVTKAELQKLKLPDNMEIKCDTWMYGTDSPDVEIPLVQCYLYLKVLHPEANHYSIPLKFSPVFNFLTKELVKIDYLPSGLDEKTSQSEPWKRVKPIEYHPELSGIEPKDIKPLIVQQPEGVSFEVEGSKIKWQDWEFRVATNAREGVVMYDVHFKGHSLFYRISLNEMTVPYCDPRVPFIRKQAFDLGDTGFGVNANQLGLGCDCLGVIKYFDTRRITPTGDVVHLKNTVCLHEQDYGILYKHMNNRTGNAVVARRREFVVQTIATVGNYEYVLNFVFDQVGAITVQVRATGILSTTPIDDGITIPWATNVGPNVTAPIHQHLLSFKFDARLGGDNNSVAYDDVVPMAYDPKLNPYKVGAVSKRTFVEKSGYIEQSPFTNRTYKVVNENVINKVTGAPVAYKFEMPAKQMILAHPDSFNVKRAKFATQQFWVTKYDDERNYAAGEFTCQSRTDRGLGLWADGKESVRNTDIVVWPTLALTHPPSTEQFPVMPSDFMQFLVSPASFFEQNPALDVPLATNGFNKSTYYEDSVAETGKACCSKL